MLSTKTILCVVALLIVGFVVFLNVFSENFNQINAGLQRRQQAVETLVQEAR